MFQLLSVLENTLSKLARYDQSSLFSSVLSLTVSTLNASTLGYTREHSEYTHIQYHDNKNNNNAIKVGETRMY